MTLDFLPVGEHKTAMGIPSIAPSPFGPKLAPLHEFWDHWGFEPWQAGPFAGVCRRQRFVKDGFLGPIAEFGARDYIVWDPGSGADRETLWRQTTPIREVMTQRFVFLVNPPWEKRRIRSFWLGFKGYLEFHAYWPGDGGGNGPKGPGGSGATDVRDLTDLVDMGLALAAERDAAEAP